VLRNERARPTTKPRTVRRRVFTATVGKIREQSLEVQVRILTGIYELRNTGYTCCPASNDG